MLTPFLRTIYDFVAAPQDQSTLAIIYADFPDGERRYMFASPSPTEAAVTNARLRLLGGRGEKAETPVQTLFRELREELVGHDTMDGITQGRMMQISELQDNALGLLARKQTEVERNAASDNLWHHQYKFSPDRFNRRQEHWVRSTNHIFGLKVTPTEFALLEAVGHETTKRDHKELSGVTVLTDSQIRQAYTRGEKFMAYSGEQKAVSMFMRSIHAGPAFNAA